MSKKAIEQDELIIDASQLGGTDDWGDEDLGSVDDLDDGLDVEDADSTEVDDDDGSPVLEADDEADETDGTDESDESDDEVDDAEEADGDGEADEADEADGDDEADDNEVTDADSEEIKDSKTQDKGKSVKVPLSRLNQEIDKRRQAEKRLAELEASPTSDKPRAEDKVTEQDSAISLDDFKAMSEAILDGDDEKALEKFAAMTQATVNQAVKGVRESARDDARNEIQVDRDTEDLHKAAADITKQYPEFDSNSDLADKGLIEEVLDLRDAFEHKGLSPAQALAKATKFVAKGNDLKDRTIKSIDQPKAKPKAKKANVSKKLKIASKEKGKLQGSPNRSSKLKKPLAELSDDDFNAATEEALARARGDFV